MFCPNINDTKTLQQFNEVVILYNGKPLSKAEFKDVSLRRNRTGADKQAMDIAYYVWDYFEGNPPTSKEVIDRIFDEQLPEKELFYEDLQNNEIKYNSQGEVLAPNGNISKLYKDIEKLIEEENKTYNIDRLNKEISVLKTSKPTINDVGFGYSLDYPEINASFQLFTNEEKEIQETIKEEIVKLEKELSEVTGKYYFNEQQSLQLYKQTRSKEFKEWFGDSKVVDENGEPLVVYHFTDIPFNDFKKEYLFSNTDKGESGAGFYFVDEVDEGYRAMYGNNYMPVFLSIQSPFITKGTKDMPELYGRTQKEISKTFGYNIDGVLKEATKLLSTDKGEYAEIVVFEPNQIKSVFNQGTFSKESNNIYFQLYKQSEQNTNISLDEKLTNLLKSIGVDVRNIEELEYDAVAKTDLLKGLIEVVEGKRDITTLPEETATIIFELLGKDNPLYKKAMEKAENTEMYKQVVDEYGEVYKNDKERLLKETCHKLIAQEIIKLYKKTNETSETKSLWKNLFDRMLKWFKDIFKGITSKYLNDLANPYRTIANNIINEDLRGLKKISELNEKDYTYEPIFYELTQQQVNEQDRIIQLAKDLKSNDESKTDVIKLPTGHGYKIKVNGTWRIASKSVTDLVKNFSRKIYKSGDDTSEGTKYLAKSGTFLHNVALSDDNGLLLDLHNKVKHLRDFDQIKKEIDKWLVISHGTNPKIKNAIEEVKQLDEMPKNDDFYKFIYSNNNLFALKQVVANRYLEMVKRQEKINKQTNSNGYFEVFTEVPLLDKLDNRPGTIDIMAVYSNGYVGISDFKFKKNYKGTPSIIQSREFDIQLSAYKTILSNFYGVENFAEFRILPVGLSLDANDKINYINYGYFYNNKTIPFGEVTVANEKLNNSLDNALVKLYAEKTKLEELLKESRSKGESDLVARLSDKLFKINSAINGIVVEGDVGKIETLLSFIYKDFNDRLSEPKMLDRVSINPNFITFEWIQDTQEILNIFNDFIEFYVPTLTEEEQKSDEIKGRIANLSLTINNLKYELLEKSKELLNNEIPMGGDIDTSAPEESFIGRYFKQLSEFGRSVFQKLSYLVKKIEWKVVKDVDKFVTDLQEILTKIEKAGISQETANKMISNIKTGKLIYKYKLNVRDTELLEALKSKNTNWLEKNTNLVMKDKKIDYDDETNKQLNEQFNAKKKELERKYSYSDKKQMLINAELNRFKERYFLYIDNKLNEKALENPYNPYIQLKETEDILSDEYNKLPKEVKELYNFYLNFIKTANEITGKRIDSKYFIPEFQGSIINMYANNGISSFAKCFNIHKYIKKALEIRQHDENGVRDENGNIINSIPLVGTSVIKDSVSSKEISEITNRITEENKDKNLTEEELNKKISFAIDKLAIQKGYALKSYDLAKSFTMFAESIFAYKYLSETEAVVKTMTSYIGNKYTQSTELTTGTGIKIFDKALNKIATSIGMKKSELEAFESFVNYYWYGQKIQGKDVEYFQKTDEKGEKIAGSGISRTKLITKIMQIISLKALGLNITAATGALIGSSANFNFVAEENQVISNKSVKKALKFITSNWKRQSRIAEFFMIGSDSNLEKANKLSQSFIDRHLTLDKALILLTKTDEGIHQLTLTSALCNYGLDSNGKIKKLDLLPEGTEPLINYFQIDEKTNKITLTKDIEEDELIKFRTMVQKTISKIIGTIPSNDISLFNTNLALKVFMQFKRWIPGLSSARFNKLKFNQALEDFDEGRFVTFGKEIFGQGKLFSKHTLKNFVDFAVKDVLLGYYNVHFNNRGLKKINTEINKLVFNKYYIENKHLFKEMTYDEALKMFLNMKQNKLNAFAAELRSMLLIIMFFLLVAAKAFDDDDEEFRNTIPFRLLNRGAMEISFFFNPLDTYNILKRPLPILSIIKDLGDITSNTVDETRDFISGEDSPYDRTPFGYYTLKNLPLGKTMIDFGIFEEDEEE